MSDYCHLAARNWFRTIQGRVDVVIWKVKSRRRSDSSQLPSFSMEEDAALERRQTGTQDSAARFFLSKKKVGSCGLLFRKIFLIKVIILRELLHAQPLSFYTQPFSLHAQPPQNQFRFRL
jgi:hypothetical protein